MDYIISTSTGESNEDYYLYWTKGPLTSEQDQKIMREIMETLSHEGNQDDVFADFERLTTMEQRLGCSILDIFLVKHSTHGIYRLSDVCLNIGLNDAFSLFFWAELFAIGNLKISTTDGIELCVNELKTRLDVETNLFVANFGIPFIQSLSIVPPKMAEALDVYLNAKIIFTNEKEEFGDISKQRMEKAVAKHEQVKLEKLIDPATCHRHSKKPAPKYL